MFRETIMRMKVMKPLSRVYLYLYWFSQWDSRSETASLARSDSASSTASIQSGIPEVLVGLAYNGTTGRLTVEIIKGSHFRWVFIHIFLVYRSEGVSIIIIYFSGVSFPLDRERKISFHLLCRYGLLRCRYTFTLSFLL